METRGRPKKDPKKLKSVLKSVRMTLTDYNRVIRDHGSLQVFFDKCLDKNIYKKL